MPACERKREKERERKKTYRSIISTFLIFNRHLLMDKDQDDENDNNISVIEINLTCWNDLFIIYRRTFFLLKIKKKYIYIKLSLI